MNLVHRPDPYADLEPLGADGVPSGSKTFRDNGTSGSPSENEWRALALLEEQGPAPVSAGV